MKFFFIANQLLKNPYPFWNVFLGKFIENNDTCILTENNSVQLTLSQIKDKICSQYDVSESSFNTCSDDVDIDSGVLFLFEPLIEDIHLKWESLQTIGFIGFEDKINEKLDYYNSIHTKTILSEMIPNEIPTIISDSNFSYFTNRGYFVPPFSKLIKINKSSSNRILIVEDSSKTYSTLEVNLLMALKSIDNFESIDLNLYDGNEAIETSKVISFVQNPQTNHALILSSQVDVHFSDPNSKNPFRNLYFEDSVEPQEFSFTENTKSIRSGIKSIIENIKAKIDNDQSNLRKPAQTIESEIESLCNFISNNEKELLPHRTLSLPTIPKVREPKQILGFPDWSLHFSTEAFLNGLLNQLDKSKVDPLQLLAEDSLYFLHSIDSDFNYFASFKKLFPRPDAHSLNRFSQATAKISNFSARYFKDVQEANIQITSKFLKVELPNCFVRKNATFDTNDYSRLLDYINTKTSSSIGSSSTEMYKSQILTMNREFDEALNFCKSFENLSTKNILFTNFAIMTALLGEYDYCSDALNLFQETDMQYAKDNVLVAYVTARLFVNELHDDKTLEIIKSYNNRKPSEAWWMSDLNCMAIVKLMSWNESSTVLRNCVKLLKVKCDFTDEDIACLVNFKPANSQNIENSHQSFINMLEGTGEKV